MIRQWTNETPLNYFVSPYQNNILTIIPFMQHGVGQKVVCRGSFTECKKSGELGLPGANEGAWWGPSWAEPKQ